MELFTSKFGGGSTSTFLAVGLSADREMVGKISTYFLIFKIVFDFLSNTSAFKIFINIEYLKLSKVQIQ